MHGGNQSTEKPNEESQTHSGGVIDGNGGEYIGNERNPWFVGTDPIPYCISKSEDFSLPAKETSADIAKAFAAWKNLLTDLRFDGISRSFDDRPAEHPFRRLARDFIEVDCTTAPPLEFKLGIFDTEVSAALKYSAAMTIGFALRTAYDDKTGMARGYIWLSPDRGAQSYQGSTVSKDFWSQPHLFANVVAHEIGHMLGFQHIAGSIMDSRLPARVVELGLDSPWEGEEFHLSRYTGLGFCGRIAYADPRGLSEIWGISSADDVTICLKWRDDLRKDDDNTPVLIEVKRAASATVEHLARIDAGSDQDIWLAGLYQEADEQGQVSYKRTWFGSLVASAMYRGSFQREGKNHALEIEMPINVPGIFILRSQIDGKWPFMSLVPEDRLDRFKKFHEILGGD